MGVRKYFFIAYVVCLFAGVMPCEGRQLPSDTTSRPADSAFIIVRNIVVKGNKKTRTNVILRELGMAPGDTLQLHGIAAQLENRRRRLLNTSLFLTVGMNIKNWEGRHADLVIEVWERWYIFPIPIFRLADRNFNQWWVEQGRSLDRVNLGVRFIQNNMTGRNDEVKAELQIGYTQRVALFYDLPYIDRTFRHGVGLIFAYSRNRELNDSTFNNKQVFFRQDQFIRQTWTAGLSYSYRKAINTRHQVFLTYNYEKVNDSVSHHNPDYLGDGRQRVSYLNLLYRMSYTNTDSWMYPLKGMLFQAEAEKMGIGPLSDFDHVRFKLRIAQYWTLYPKTYAALGLRAQVKTPANQPYANQKAIGYQEDYLRGLEYYVVDGTSFFIAKSTLRKQVYEFNIHMPLLPERVSTIPIRLLAKVYGDGGYAYSKRYGYGMLNNRFLYTGGIGVDIVTYFDSCLRIEYSINQLGQKGLFLHTKLDM